MKPENSKHLFALLMLFWVVSFSCKKQDSHVAIKTDSADFQNVSSWLDAQKLLLTDSGISKIVLIKANLSASALRVEKFNEKENLIIVPLKDNYQAGNATMQKRFMQLVLVENESGKIRRGDLIEIVPKDQKTQSVPTGLIANVYSNKENNFDGIFNISTVADRFVYEIQYNKGTIAATKFMAAKKNNNAAGRTEGCIDWFLQTYLDGVFHSEFYVGSTCLPEVEEGSASGAGGGSSSSAVVTVNDIIKLLADKCLLNVVNVLGDAEFKNQIVKLFNETYVGNGNVANLRFQENGALYNETDGSPRAAKSSIEQPSGQSGLATWVITLNPNYGTGVSNEFWASTIVHELVHSFLRIYTQNGNQPISMNEQHQVVFDKWIKQMADFMTKAYGISKDDATSLALGGLDEVLKDESTNYSTFKPQFEAMALNKYKISLSTAEATRYEYKTGAKGTKCN